MLSVLVPVYHIPIAWFSQCLSSIETEAARFEALHPGEPATEIVLVNDGITQVELLAYLDTLRGQPRMRVVDAPLNLGVPGALNLGLDACRFDLIARMDFDDIVLPGRFEAQWQHMQREPDIDVLGTALHYYRPDGRGGWRVGELVRHPEVISRNVALRSLWFMNHPTVMIRRTALLAVGAYDESLRGRAEDYELWIRMLRRGRVLHNLPQPFHLLRTRPGSVSQAQRPDNLAFMRSLQAALAADAATM